MQEKDMETSGIQSLDYNRENIEDLCTVLPMVVPFVGAGLSIPHGYPGWTDFLIKSSREIAEAETIAERLRCGKYEEVASFLNENLGKCAFRDKIKRTFDGSKPPVPCRTAASILSELARGPVVTTNYDRVLESTFEKECRPFNAIVLGRNLALAGQAIPGNEKYLLKVHGDAVDPSSHILTLEEYKDAYGSADPNHIDWKKPIPKLLRQIFVARPVLFLGCSLTDDRTVKVLKIIGDEMDGALRHYAIVPLPDSNEGIQERKRFLSDHWIRPIWYPSGRHNLIVPFLEFLARQSSSVDSEHHIYYVSRRIVNSVLPQVERVSEPIANGVWGLILRLQRLLSHLHDMKKIGSLEEPNEYIQARLTLVRIRHPVFPGSLCFFGLDETTDTVLAMCGSSGNVLSHWESDLQEDFSAKLSLMENMMKELVAVLADPGDAMRGVGDAYLLPLSEMLLHDGMPESGLGVNLNILAWTIKRLKKEEWRLQHDMVIAQPVYIAFAGSPN